MTTTGKAAQRHAAVAVGAAAAAAGLAVGVAVVGVGAVGIEPPRPRARPPSLLAQATKKKHLITDEFNR